MFGKKYIWHGRRDWRMSNDRRIAGVSAGFWTRFLPNVGLEICCCTSLLVVRSKEIYYSTEKEDLGYGNLQEHFTA
jgi:hypothetical protein